MTGVVRDIREPFFIGVVGAGRNLKAFLRLGSEGRERGEKGSAFPEGLFSPGEGASYSVMLGPARKEALFFFLARKDYPFPRKKRLDFPLRKKETD